MKKIHVNHVDIFYEMVGQGRPVVLIHGNGEDHTVFDRTVHLLEETYTCYLPDSRGHGKSHWTGSLPWLRAEQIHDQRVCAACFLQE